jgi:hypothetical protein
MQMDVEEGAKKRMFDDLGFSSITSAITDDKVNQ